MPWFISRIGLLATVIIGLDCKGTKKRDNHLPLAENFNLKSNTMKNSTKIQSFYYTANILERNIPLFSDFCMSRIKLCLICNLYITSSIYFATNNMTNAETDTHHIIHSCFATTHFMSSFYRLNL